MHISKIITKGLGTLIEFEAKLQMIEDKEFYHLHEQIIKKTSKMSPLPGLGQASCIRVNLNMPGLPKIQTLLTRFFYYDFFNFISC